MRVQCAWCGMEMPEKDGQASEDVSHSICMDCLEQTLFAIGIEERTKKSRKRVTRRPQKSCRHP